MMDITTATLGTSLSVSPVAASTDGGQNYDNAGLFTLRKPISATFCANLFCMKNENHERYVKILIA